MKVALTGGGTGGHTLPVLAVIKSLKRENPDLATFFIGSRFAIESSLIPKMGIKYYGISAGKFRRYHRSRILNIIDPATLFKNISDALKFFSGIREARKILAYENPDVLFAKGGFVSLPVAYAARSLRIPIVNHESDLVMGLANRKISGFSKKVCVSFPKDNFPDIKKEKLVETGNPIRDDILMGDRRRLFSEIGFEGDKKTILSLGGSQGSLFLNETIIEVIDEILEEWQLIMVAGEKDIDYVMFKTKNLPVEKRKKLKIYGFLTSEMADVYSAADLVIARSGSNTLFELAALGKPAILVPHDVSPGGHQFENARLFSRSGAALLFKQQDLTSKKLLGHIKRLLSNEKELREMSEKMKKWADMGSADKIAQVVLEEGRKHEKDRESKKK